MPTVSFVEHYCVANVRKSSPNQHSMTHISIKGTRTEKNLVRAYHAESAAYTRYVYYAAQAKKERYFPVQQIFEETAANELRHSKVFFKHLVGGSVCVDICSDAGVIDTTAQNLVTAIHEEAVEGYEMYRASAEVALEEGYTDIAVHFESIAAIEELHRQRFEYLRALIDRGELWKRQQPILWKCQVCGYEYYGTEPPAQCPACDHPREHYMPLDLYNIAE